MAEYIEREAAKKEFNLNFGSVSHAIIANRILDLIPAADVAPVVRCKDCKHGEPSNIRRGWRYCGLHITHHSGDNFCSYGERKEG